MIGTNFGSLATDSTTRGRLISKGLAFFVEPFYGLFPRWIIDGDGHMWITIIVVLGLDPVFQGTASPLSNHVGSGVFETRDACESDLITYFQTFEGKGESRLSFTKNQWGNYRITKEHEDKAFREVQYCMEIHPNQ